MQDSQRGTVSLVERQQQQLRQKVQGLEEEITQEIVKRGELKHLSPIEELTKMAVLTRDHAARQHELPGSDEFSANCNL